MTIIKICTDLLWTGSRANLPVLTELFALICCQSRKMVDEATKKSLAQIPLLKTKAGPRDGEFWVERLKEEYQSLIKYVQNNKEADNDWFRLESNKEGTRWFGKCWYFNELLKYEFDVEFDIPVTYPTTAPEIAIPELDGKTAKMYRGGKICMTDHFKPLWARNVPKFGIAHAMSLGALDAKQVLMTKNSITDSPSNNTSSMNTSQKCSDLKPRHLLLLPIPHIINCKLGPWLAVEIPDLIQKGLVEHKQKETGAGEK